MASFTYDLISFLRVLYRRRYFIVIGTFLSTVLVAIVALLWPETWRADARVLVSTPVYKQDMRLVPAPFDVLTYQGILTSDELYREILLSLVWFRDSVQVLSQTEAQETLKAQLGAKAEGITPLQVIALADINQASPVILAQNPAPNLVLPRRARILDSFSLEELETIAEMDRDALAKVSVFDLRKALQANVTIVRETNVETEYSNIIDISAQFNTAIGAKLVANLWVELFLDEAEQVVRATTLKPISMVRQTFETLRTELRTAAKALANFKADVPVEKIRAEIATKMVTLTGVAPTRNLLSQSTEDFDTTDQTKPFLQQSKETADIYSFTVTPLYSEALIPQKYLLERRRAAGASIQSATKNNDADRMRLEAERQELEKEYDAIVKQISALTGEITQSMQTLEQNEYEMASLQRQMHRAQEALDSIQPLLVEARLLEQPDPGYRYSDIQPGYAITPDKRVSPKRSFMCLGGAAVAFVLFCGLSFFLDIWNEVTKPETAV